MDVGQWVQSLPYGGSAGPQPLEAQTWVSYRNISRKHIEPLPVFSVCFCGAALNQTIVTKQLSFTSTILNLMSADFLCTFTDGKATSSTHGPV